MEKIYVCGTVTNNVTGEVFVFTTTSVKNYQKGFFTRHFNNERLDQLLRRYNDMSYWNWRVTHKGIKQQVTEEMNCLLNSIGADLLLNKVPNAVVVVAHGRRFRSMREAADAMGVTTTTIQYRARTGDYERIHKEHKS